MAMTYFDDQLRELCNAIVLQAVSDCRRGILSREELRRFLSSSWGVQLLRGSTTSDAVLEHLKVR